MSYAYRADQELPSMAFDWLDRDGNTIDFSTGWTFAVKITAATAPGTVLTTKSTGITGAATLPNVVVDWAAGDFTDLAPEAAGTAYIANLVATRTSDGKTRIFAPDNPPHFTLLPALA